MADRDLAPQPLFLPGSTVPRRPSDQWFESLAWMDGATKPPILFHTNADRIAALQYYRPGDPRIDTIDHVEAPEMYQHAHPQSAALLGFTPTNTVETPADSSTEASDTSAAPVAGTYRITITMKWTAVDDAAPRVGSKAPTTKKFQENKSAMVVLRDISRKNFILAIARPHGQHEKYTIGTTGPSFKLWWTGSGGKANAITIDKDDEFTDAVKLILAKTGAKAQVNVEFDIDTWVPFRTRKRTLGDRALEDGDDDDIELVNGTKVPRISDFSHQDRMHGHFVELIEARWKCNQHGGENNAPGFCFVDAAGAHIGLNMRKKKLWAAAIAAGETSVQAPPNHLEFDGARDGRVTSTKPRGRNGPYRVDAPATPTPSNEPITLLLAALTAKMVNDMGGTPVTPVQGRDAPLPATPKKARAPLSVPFSPIPTLSNLLHACLEDFYSKEGVDLTTAEGALAELRFNPAVIPRVPLNRLIEVTGAVEGDAILLQGFCEKWCARLEEKKRNAASPF